MTEKIKPMKNGVFAGDYIIYVCHKCKNIEHPPPQITCDICGTTFTMYSGEIGKEYNYNDFAKE